MTRFRIALFRTAIATAMFAGTHRAISRPLLAQASEERAVLDAVDRLFTAMRSKDTAGVRGTFDPTGRLVGMRPRADGSTYLQVLSVDQFVTFLGRDNRGAWNERAFEPKVFIDGTMATVWAAYDFHLGDTLTNCGTDSVQLLKVAGAWKIVSIADTYRTTCQERGRSPQS